MRRIPEHGRGRIRLFWAVTGAILLLAAPGWAAGSADTFPEILPSTRTEAIMALAGRSLPTASTPSSLTPGLLSARENGPAEAAARRQALALLDRDVWFPRELGTTSADGVPIRFTDDPGSFDRIALVDADADGHPDVLEAVREGLEMARRLMVDRLALPAPEVEVLLLGLGGHTDGYLLPPRAPGGRQRIVIEAAPTGPIALLGTAAAREYAHAVLVGLNPRFAPGWVAAFGEWTTLALTPDGPDGAAASLLSARIANLSSGLLAPLSGSAAAGAGNALWFAFLDSYHGPAAVTATVEELAREAWAPALDRALRRSVDSNLPAAFREFHVWTVLVGSRDDGHHFPFASRLADAPFASESVGLPTLSVQHDPAVAPLGATQVRLTPDRGRGGLRVQFEGGFGPGWELDLILLRTDGTKQRVPVPLNEGRADQAVPLDGLAEAWLLVRNLGSEGEGARRYSYTAQMQKGFPFELGSIEATAEPDGVALAWETLSEERLFAYNVLRIREEGGSTVTVNPMWIPALGGPLAPTAYRFVDRSARPGVDYRYVIQGITMDGLLSESEPVSARIAPVPPPRQR